MAAVRKKQPPAVPPVPEDRDEYGLRRESREKLREIVIQARDALDKLAEALQ